MGVIPISSASRRPLNRDASQGVGTSEPTVKVYMYYNIV